MIAVQVIFWLCVLGVAHSYVLYPLLLKILAGNKKLPDTPLPSEADLPHVYVLMAVYNEEAVLQQKMDSMLESDYPADKIHFLIGSDSSTDNTNNILKSYTEKHRNITCKIFSARTGKIPIINQLYTENTFTETDILLLTDANVMFTPETIPQLVKHLSRPDVGLVGANVLNSGMRSDGISIQENQYIKGENNTKFNEGVLWGVMMGAFGACYALKARLFKPVPTGFKVDDFYITMQVLRQGYKSIKVPAAVCYEDVSNEISEEFRRKSRIAAGNFQNLASFPDLLWPPFKPVAFAFFSHKVLRWFGPLLIIAAYILNMCLFNVNVFYRVTFLVQNLLLLVPLIEILFRRIGIHSIPLRFVTYFMYMNLALLAGLINYLKGDRQNVWEPTKRNR